MALKKNMICPTGLFATKFISNKNASGKVVGIGVGCGAGGALANVTGTAESYIGAQSSSSNSITGVTTVGFSKIRIVKDSTGIKDVIFYNYDSSTSSDASADSACRGNGNCLEISCNGGKISGLKAQSNSTSIQALSVTCLGNNNDATFLAENICPLYARIVNNEADKSPGVAGAIGISDDDANESSKIFSATTSTFTLPSLTNAKISRIYLGLQGYASADKKKLTDPECKIPLDIVGCEIDSSTCATTNFSSSRTIAIGSISGCHSGDGINGQAQTGKAGTGGGGGGNNSKATRVPSAYEANDSAQAGKNGESYINPEFDFGFDSW